MGVDVVKVKDRRQESFYTEDDAKNYEAQKAQYQAQTIMDQMAEEAGVKDNRARFF